MRSKTTVGCLLISGFSTVLSFGTDSINRNRELQTARGGLYRPVALNENKSQIDNEIKSEIDIKVADETREASVFLQQAKILREQASLLQKQLREEKEARIRKETAKVDSLIDLLLFHGSTNYSKTELLNTEEQVAELLISKRLNYDQVNQIFDRLCELSNRPQSIDSCSPLLSLLLDAACKVDCLEREDNPNKRWNHRVERKLRQKLFALGYGIRIEDVQKKNEVLSVTGEKDIY
ncbi:hypothetical protein ACHAXN_002827 [Cyclotella atomus]